LPLQTVDLVFDDDTKKSMAITGSQRTEATGTFPLDTSRGSYPHRSFAFRATDENGNASRRSGIHRIEVVPDQPPMVQWADTATGLKDVAEINLPINKKLQLPIQAEDPDFALRTLRFKTESTSNKQIRIPDAALLESPTSGPTEHRGQIKRTVAFSPADKRLTVGDTAELWVEASDTKLPAANVSATRRNVGIGSHPQYVAIAKRRTRVR
jgi:hypothetical protein